MDKESNTLKTFYIYIAVHIGHFSIGIHPFSLEKRDSSAKGAMSIIISTKKHEYRHGSAELVKTLNGMLLNLLVSNKEVKILKKNLLTESMYCFCMLFTETLQVQLQTLPSQK